MVFTLNEIAAISPEGFLFHNGNEVILHKYGLNDFIKLQNDDDDHGQDYDIEDILPRNITKGLIIFWHNFKDGCMILLPK